MLPDITALGPYTYIVTEVVFGSVALVLLVRAGAVRRAAKTVLALYPIAYAWDWYTLEVGVFAIETRTGIDLLGIPIEEHVFIVVVPSLVIAFHETIHGPSGGTADPDAESESEPGSRTANGSGRGGAAGGSGEGESSPDPTTD